MFDEEYCSWVRVTKMDLLELDEEARRYANIETRNINNFYELENITHTNLYEFNCKQDSFFHGHSNIECK